MLLFLLYNANTPRASCTEGAQVLVAQHSKWYPGTLPPTIRCTIVPSHAGPSYSFFRHRDLTDSVTPGPDRLSLSRPAIVMPVAPSMIYREGPARMVRCRGGGEAGGTGQWCELAEGQGWEGDAPTAALPTNFFT